MILLICSPLWHALKSSLTAFLNSGLAVCIKDKHQVLSCSHPSSIRQSESYSQNVNWIMSLPCSVSSSGFPMFFRKNLQGLFCGLIPKARLPPRSLVPAPESHSSIISSLFPCATRCSSLFYCNISSSVTSAHLPLPPPPLPCFSSSF